jgi:hypothetical protein
MPKQHSELNGGRGDEVARLHIGERRAAIHLRVKACPAVSVTCWLINLGVGLLEQAG